ncbi:S-adenosyl-L-methionine-dependent methyltransferase [Irpex rosettiformis]|uniref:S-adenosyl-L-methionine-dependent methyltransferase n=1 Tax=Irpex rosettiformis TaxID=378272 RepID=A0ACB8UL33_9APHY|nr:S-adenosyl-L-methionine-dependent methyltransferase [Irpex rosettiformis]
MSRRNRPTAFDVTFGGFSAEGHSALTREASTGRNSLYCSGDTLTTLRSSTLPVGPSNDVAMSASPSVGAHSPAKRKQEQRVVSYRPNKQSHIEAQSTRCLDPSALDEYILETEDAIIIGEDEPAEGCKDKPIRLLSEFVIFDPAHGNTLVSIDELHKANNKHFEAAGRVGPVCMNEEDAGQDYEAELNDAQLNDTQGLYCNQLQRFRTSAILSFSIDYGDQQGPVVLQTSFAFYMLGKPSWLYNLAFKGFYTPHRLAQLVISTALQDQVQHTKQNFMSKYQDEYDDLMDDIITKDLLDKAYPTIVAVMQNDQYSLARKSPFILSILSCSTHSAQPILAPPTHKAYGLGDIDLQVLRPENQNTTIVTPLIAHLAEGYFRESLHVLGPKFAPSSSESQDSAQKILVKWLRRLMRAGDQVEFEAARSNYCNQAKVNHSLYCVGDVVAVPAVQYEGREFLPLPRTEEEIAKIPITCTLADYFWFGRILYIDRKQKTAHVQWFEHASKTLLQEIHDPNELFLTETCGTIELWTILKKCICHFINTRHKDSKLPEIKSCWRNLEFYYSYIYNQSYGSFTQADENSALPLPGSPPDNCPVCARAAAQDLAQAPQVVEQGSGVAIGGYIYHLNDYALAKSDGGPCLIGQVEEIKASVAAREQGACHISLRLFGRVRDVIGPEDEDRLSDEHEIFLTDEIVIVEANALLKPCRVKAASSLSSEKLQAYLNLSSAHFYARFHCQKATPFSWCRRTVLQAMALTICGICHAADQATAKQMEDFDQIAPLKAFDPFAGTGAFALSMQEAGILKLTHAIELSPSTARTLKKNSPKTLVYNQCANRILESSVKKDIKEQSSLLSIEEKELPPMIKPGDVDCVIAGFPCQPHSTLNMYQRANDKKSHLILNLLSWIDFLRPRHCFFENVRGFIHYSLNATQHNKYKLKGGIQVGGLKFLVHSLLVMGYQVRFCLLEAAHYGTPQARVRFFLIASQLGHTLPSIPAPMYDLPTKDALAIRFPHNLTITPITPTSGLVPHRYISVEDAISDLPWFDWRNPFNPAEQPRRVGNEVILLKSCNQQKPTCGISQPIYRYAEPHTRFQARARIRQDAITNLQHYTRPFKKATVAFVTYIKLQAGANFKDLFDPTAVPQSLVMKEWQTSNPSSAVARRGFKDNFYGRLDKDKWFHTTVTNVEPMAKQSWVLNPWCKRILTVRELARSQGFPDDFQFYSVKDNDVKMMHREIGNAVPWPVGLALARELKEAEFKDWCEKKASAIVIE